MNRWKPPAVRFFRAEKLSSGKGNIELHISGKICAMQQRKNARIVLELVFHDFIFATQTCESPDLQWSDSQVHTAGPAAALCTRTTPQARALQHFVSNSQHLPFPSGLEKCSVAWILALVEKIARQTMSVNTSSMFKSKGVPSCSVERRRQMAVDPNCSSLSGRISACKQVDFCHICSSDCRLILSAEGYPDHGLPMTGSQRNWGEEPESSPCKVHAV